MVRCHHLPRTPPLTAVVEVRLNTDSNVRFELIQQQVRSYIIQEAETLRGQKVLPRDKWSEVDSFDAELDRIFIDAGESPLSTDFCLLFTVAILTFQASPTSPSTTTTCVCMCTARTTLVPSSSAMTVSRTAI